MYQIFTSNTGLHELYDYREDLPFYEKSNGFKLPNKKYYSAIERRFNFIIEYRKFRSDGIRVCNEECTCCKIQRIFHKGSREKFQSLEFDIEFNGDVIREHALKIVRKLNKGGKLLKLGDKIIWRENFDSNNRYVIDNGEESHLDFIMYPEIIDKLNGKDLDYEIEIIEEICELRDNEYGMGKRAHECNDSNEYSKRLRISQDD
ncbi:12082_t:CDS:1 [Acaulospora morrowiae]|uniref:12082_t:CDS:1 n=1 Tax=Acaulospora morrowiae TaxID=94023 RepID=A0A9N9FVR7_9GLOM|nr:12082_t:CDS:1 [Acaulospora morrowiae]